MAGGSVDFGSVGEGAANSQFGEDEGWRDSEVFAVRGRDARERCMGSTSDCLPWSVRGRGTEMINRFFR